MHDGSLPDLLLDEPSLMGIESIEIDTVNLRMVARTLPGKQFEVGRRLRTLVVAALRKADIVCAPSTATVDVLDGGENPSTPMARASG
jgi:small conductance mechanosensitive channel